MTSYNRGLAMLYAMKWGAPGARNPKWPNYTSPHGGGDCTNFISQALFAGGWEMVFGPRMRGVDWYAWPDDRNNRSKSWASAEWFTYFLEQSARARKVTNLKDLTIGDLIQEILPGQRTPDHTMIVTNVGPTDIYLTYHSQDYLNTSFSDVQGRASQNARFVYWKILDRYPTTSTYADMPATGTLVANVPRDSYDDIPMPEKMW